MADSPATYVRDSSGWESISMSSELRSACVAEARLGATFAESIAPSETGEYKSRFEVEAVTVPSRYGPRVGAELSNATPWAAAIEFGNGRANAQHIFAQTAAFMGGSA